MNQWSDAIKGMAPRAGQPGAGAGNIPYAPGIMGGGGGGKAADMLQKVHQSSGMANARQAMTQVTSGADPSQMQMPPPGQLQWTPEVQQHVMQYLQSILQQTKPGDQLSTTGGMTNSGYRI